MTVFHQTGMVRTEVETAGSDIVKSKCRQAPPNTFSYPLILTDFFVIIINTKNTELMGGSKNFFKR